MTTDSQHCPECSAPLPANAPAGLCPRCIMAMNMATQTDFSDEAGPHGTRVLKQAPTPEELADKFPELEILELLGRGGMGAVYKARQKELDRIVALKILPPAIGDDPAFSERFSREAKALAKLNHPNIVTLYEFGRADGLFFFLMEFVDGVNLRQLLDTGRVASREALAIVPQICDALQYAHDQGIVHRDIKPENILMDRRGRVKVADFGLAKLVGVGQVLSHGEGNTGLESPVNWQAGKPALQGEALTDAGKIMGTPQYMAPEQRDRPLEVDHRVDIYALGVVFYQMLTGELPGKRMDAPSKKVQIDVRLDEIVMRALESKPELRYQSAEELKTRVETMGATPPVSAAAPKKNGRSLALAWLFLIGAVCAVVNMAYALSTSHRVDWALVYGWAIGAVGFSILGVRYFLAAHSQKKADEHGVPLFESQGTNKGREQTSPAHYWAERHRGMPKVLWVALVTLGISALCNLILLSKSGPLGLFEAWFKTALILGLWFRFRAAYLLTMVSACFAGALVFKFHLEAGLIIGAITLAVVIPVVSSTRWFFPLEMIPTRRRLWLGSTAVLALIGFLVMLAAPAPKPFSLSRSNKVSGGSMGGTNTFPMTAQEWNDSRKVFGPVIERIVRNEVAGAPDCMIDLDSGRLVTPPAPEKADWVWTINNGIDASGATGPDTRGLIPKGGTVVLPVSSERWDSITPLEIRQILIPLVSDEEALPMAARGELPATYLFKTASRGMGILQITGFTDTSAGVNIRYKLLQKPRIAEPKSGEHKITLTNGVTVEVVAVTRDPLENDDWWKPDGTMLPKPPGNRVELTPTGPGGSTKIGKNDHAIFLQYSWNAGISVSAFHDEYKPGAEMLGYLQIREGRSVALAFDGVKRWGRMLTGGTGGPQPDYKDIGTSKVLRFPAGTQEATVEFSTAAGPWETVAVYDGMRTKVSVNGVQVLCTPVPANPRNGDRKVLNVTHDIDLEKYALRMFAVLKNGKREETHFYNSKLPSRETQSSVFLGGFEQDAANVKEYILEWTPWVRGEIRGIALNPGGKKSGAAVAQISHIKQGNRNEQASYQIHADADVEFGTVIEIELEGWLSSNSAPKVLDLDTDKTFTIARTNSQETIWDDVWVRTNWVDLAVLAQNHGWGTHLGLKTDDLLLSHPLKQSDWDSMSADNLLQKIDSLAVPRDNPKFHVENGKLEFPLTYAFKTREGSVGLIQVTGISDDFNRVKLRYKRVRPAVEGTDLSAADEAVFVLPFNPRLAQKVLDASRDFAIEHQWKVASERGRTSNDSESVTIETRDLSGKKVSFTVAGGRTGMHELTVVAEPGAEFPAGRIGIAIARRLNLRVESPQKQESHAANEFVTPRR